MNNSFIVLDYAGNLELQTVCVRIEHIVSLQKPKKDKFGCIVTTVDGDKFPVKQSYEAVLQKLTAET